MRMRRLLSWSLVVALSGAAAPVAHAEEVSFMGWVGLFDFQKAGWENIVASFEKKYPEYKVNYIGTPNEQTLNQAVVAINGGNAPDLIQVNPGWVPQLRGMNALADLSSAIPETTLSQVPEGYRKAMTFDSGLAALPWIPGPITMIYNRGLMKEAGLDPNSPPKTWDEFADAVKKICSLGDRNGGKVYGVALRSAQQPPTGLWAVPMIWAQGGNVVDADGKVSFNTPEAKSVIEWYRDTITSGCSPEFFDIQQSRNVFGQGRAGFIFEGPWVRGVVETLSGGALKVGPEADVWVAEMPSKDGNSPRNLDNSNMLVLTKKAENNPAAIAFLDFIVSDPQAVEFFYETSNQLTTSRTDLIGFGKMAGDAYIQAFAGTLDTAIPAPIRDIQATAMLDALALAIQSVTKGGDVDAELKSLDQTIDRLRD